MALGEAQARTDAVSFLLRRRPSQDRADVPDGMTGRQTAETTLAGMLFSASWVWPPEKTSVCSIGGKQLVMIM